MYGMAIVGITAFLALASPEDCKECSPQKLCAPHQAAETEGLKAAATGLKAADPAQRLKALEAIAQLKDAHENAPSAAAAKALGAGLNDASWNVRASTATLLAKGQEHATAVDLLSKSLTTAREDGVKWMAPAGRSGMSEEQKTFGAFLKADAEAIVAVKDDRAAAALIEFLKKATGPMPEPMILPVIQAVGKIGTYDSFEIVIERLAQSEGFGGARSYHDVLVATAKEHGGKDLPDWGPRTSAKWKTWLESHKALFPKKLAKS